MKLFISYSGLLSILCKGREISEEDLNSGLFYFGCTREHAMNPGKAGEESELKWFTADDPEKGQRIQARIVTALKKAEVEGRVAWRLRGEYNSYEQLNELLKKNGLRPVTVDDSDWNRSDHFNYPAAEIMVRETNQDLEAVWR